MTAEDRTPDPDLRASPYALAFEHYYNAGWRGVLPLPARKKKSPPDGYTGNEGATPSYADLQEWAGTQFHANIALRLPRGVVGIDVDDYDGKGGALTFAKLIAQHGPLPATWRSTSRDDGVSAIRLYRIPQGLAWPGILGPGIEVIRYAHRYAVVWPSLHPEGRTYRWIDPAGQAVIGVVPRVEDLPELPEAWITGLTGGEAERVGVKADLTDEATRTWIAERAGGTACRAVASLLGRYTLSLDVTGGARHEAALKATRALVEMAGEGHPGVATALEQVHAAFVRAIDGDPERRGEWERMVTGAVRLAAANHPEPEGGDPCDDPMHGLLINPIQPPRSDLWTAPAASIGTVPSTPTASPSPSSPSVTTPAAPSMDTSGPLPAATDAPTGTPDDPDGLAALRQQYLMQEVERERARREAKRVLDREETEALAADNPNRFVTGAAFVLDLPEIAPSVWGTGSDILWMEGEALIIAGSSGVGKTSIASQVMAAMLGLADDQRVLGLDVARIQGNVLYLAMDRPQQAARALGRLFRPEHRPVLEQRLKVWQGPPPTDVAKAPETLLNMATAADATVLIVDSLKDAAIGLSDDAVGAGYNRARQMCLAAGIQVLELHHMVKKGSNGAKPKELADVYGSAHLVNGAGSVIILHGDAGDPVVELVHLKQPMEEVGPFKVLHDHRAGVSSIFQTTDLVTVARLTGAKGVSAKAAAQALFESDKPSAAQTQKARRRLVHLAESGALILVPGNGPGGVPDSWVAAQPDAATLGGLVRDLHAPSRTPEQGAHAPSRLGGQPSRSEQTRRSQAHADFETVDDAVEAQNGQREPVTSTDTKNVKAVKVSVNPPHAAPPKGGGPLVRVERDSGARVVLDRGGHRVVEGTGEIVE